MVDRFWILRARATPSAPLVNRVLPDGRIDIIFQLGAAPAPQPARPAAYVVGPMRAPLPIRYDAPPHVVGVRFLPGASAALIPVPPAEIVDAVVDLADAGAAWRDTPALLDELACAPDDTHRLNRLAHCLSRRARSGLGADPAALALERSGGALTVAQLARLAGIGERQLERRFRERLGLTPRFARRIARFKQAVRLLSRAPASPWPEIVHACGFYDQSHLIREFQAFAGETPVRHAQRAAGRVGSIQDGRGGPPHRGDAGTDGLRSRRTA